MNWIIIAIGAYFLNAVAIAIDKFLLTKKISNPAVYAFFISALSLVALVLIPFGFSWPTTPEIIIAVITGAVFCFALLFMFKAIRLNEASRVTPFMGGLQPIFIFVLAWLFLGETLGTGALIGFIIIILGTIVISIENRSGQNKKIGYLFALISTLLFAVSYTLNKYVYLNDGFITGFILTRVGAFLGALVILLKPQNYRDVVHELKNGQTDKSSWFLGGQIAGALSFIIINYVISVSDSVALVNALQGTQYIFLIFIMMLLTRFFPGAAKEKFTKKIILQKFSATILIILGLFLIFFN